MSDACDATNYVTPTIQTTWSLLHRSCDANYTNHMIFAPQIMRRLLHKPHGLYSTDHVTPTTVTT